MTISYYKAQHLNIIVQGADYLFQSRSKAHKQGE